MNIYLLSSPESTYGSAWYVDKEVIGQTIRCSVNPNHIHGGKRQSDLSILLTARIIKSFIWTWYSDCILPEETYQWFLDMKFTGFTVRPVKARMKRKPPEPVIIPPLWELVLTGWGGIAPEESGVRLREYCPYCKRVIYTGFQNPTTLFDEKQWDGSDIFMIWPLPGYVFITERVADAIKKKKMTGCRVLPLADIGTADSLGPGLLSYYFSIEKIRELNIPDDFREKLV